LGETILSTGYVDLDGGRVWYEESGEGPAVLLLHAAGADSRMWDAQWLPFSERFRVVRFDFPGAGRSSYFEAEWNATELLDLVLDNLDIGAAAVVGVSLGGSVAVDYAIERPRRTWALLAVATAPRGLPTVMPDPRSVEVYTLLLAGRLGRAAEMFVDVWCPLRTSSDLDKRIQSMVRDNIGMLAQMPQGIVRLPEWSAAERLSEITVPTLTMWGDRDERSIRDGASHLAADVPGARSLVLPGVDHFVPMRAPEVFTREALAFLEAAAPERHAAATEH
jgi:pimeloyl-ACP methyl ester carboxylesterase